MQVPFVMMARATVHAPSMSPSLIKGFKFVTEAEASVTSDLQTLTFHLWAPAPQLQLVLTHGVEFRRCYFIVRCIRLP